MNPNFENITSVSRSAYKKLLIMNIEGARVPIIAASSPILLNDVERVAPSTAIIAPVAIGARTPPSSTGEILAISIKKEKPRAKIAM